MARSIKFAGNIDNSDPVNYPQGRIKNNTGSNDGTPVNEYTNGDLQQFFVGLMDMAGMDYNGLPDSKSNGYQLIEAARALASKSDILKSITVFNADTIRVPVKVGKMVENEIIVFKAGFNSVTTPGVPSLYVKVFGDDNVERALQIDGEFKTNDLVIFHFTASTVYARAFVDTKSSPNLNDRLTALENSLAPMQAKLEVFQAGGGMVLWNKPLADIPPGWAEVVDWRDRIPKGWATGEVVGQTGGSKQKTLTMDNLPADGVNYQDSYFLVDDNTGSFLPGGGRTNVGGNYFGTGSSDSNNNTLYWRKNKSDNLGSAVPVDVMNPYRVVYFIEWVGL